jgi:type IV pilus assembly protein PilC
VQDLADDRQLEHGAVDALASLLEPLIMVIIGTMVGGMVVAMYLPIFDMVNAVQ